MPSLRASQVHVQHILKRKSGQSDLRGKSHGRKESEQTAVLSDRTLEVCASGLVDGQVDLLRRDSTDKAAIRELQRLRETRVRNALHQLEIRHKNEQKASHMTHGRRKNTVRSQITTHHSQPPLPTTSDGDMRTTTTTTRTNERSTGLTTFPSNIYMRVDLAWAMLRLECEYFCERRRMKKDQAIERKHLENEERVFAAKAFPTERKHSPLSSKARQLLSSLNPPPGRGILGMEACPRGVEPVIPVKNGRFRIDS